MVVTAAEIAKSIIKVCALIIFSPALGRYSGTDAKTVVSFSTHGVFDSEKLTEQSPF
jgi:hypothetical protein